MNLDGYRPERLQRLAWPALALAFGAGAVLSIAAWSPFPLLFAALVLLVVYPWYRSTSRGRLDLFEPIVLHSVFFGMIVLALFDRVYLSRTSVRYELVSLSHDQAFTLLCLLYGALFACTLLGYYWLGPTVSWPSPGNHRVVSLAERASGSAFRLIAVGYGLLGIASLVAIVLFVFPTPDPLYVFRATTPRSDLFAGNNGLVVGTRGIYLGYLFWIGGALADRRAPSPLELLAVVPVVGFVLVTGGRSRAFQIVLMVSVVAYYVFVEDALPITRGAVARIAGRAPPVVVLGILPLVAAASAVVLVALRGIRQGQSIATALGRLDPIAVATAGIQNDWFDNFLALTAVVPERFGFYYGAFYLRVPLNFVPGRFWPEKPPLTVGSVFRRAVLPERAGGRNTGALGDYYVNFGYPGVVPMGLLYGAALYGLSRLLAGRRTSPLRLIVYAIFLSIVVRTGLTNEVLYTASVHLLLLAPGVLGLAALASRDDDRPES